jgi:hypothetical protein
MDNGPNNLPAASSRLNNFQHRSLQDPTIETPEDLLTEVTPAQRERLIYLVDDAIDTMESLLASGAPDIKIRAAENVLDRAGLSRATKTEKPHSGLDIPAEALVEVIGGLAKMFGKRNEASLKDVSPLYEQHEVPTPRSHVSHSEDKPKTTLPKSLLERYKEGKQ